jgi:thymidylate kinase
MKIIILEGIATSGKTSVKDELEILLKNKSLKYKIIEETETLLPILHNLDPKISADHIQNILNEYITYPVDVLIFDRLYLTNIWRTKGSISIFSKSTKLLTDNQTLICFLEINKKNIQSRIQYAMSHRDEKWNEYVNKKGKDIAEIIDYYTRQQTELLGLLKQTQIKHQTFNTDDLDFKKIAKDIFSTL